MATIAQPTDWLDWPDWPQPRTCLISQIPRPVSALLSQTKAELRSEMEGEEGEEPGSRECRQEEAGTGGSIRLRQNNSQSDKLNE